MRPLRSLAVLLAVVVAGCAEPPPPVAQDPVLDRLRPSLGEDGFRAASPDQAIQLPRDHLPHVDTRIEWWYLTGHLSDAFGGAYGFQLALFRFGLEPRVPESDASGWRAHQVFMVHAALTDLGRDRFLFRERLLRPLPGLAEAGGPPLRVRIGDCSLESIEGPDLFPARIQCTDEAPRFDLRLEDLGGPVLHGKDGYSIKSNAPGSASWYYSFPRLAAEGRIESDGQWRAVQGQAWMDHEWGSGVLAEDQAGWDWWSIQLDEGSALMLFQIRGRDGSVQSTRGSFIPASGPALPFAEGAVTAEPLRWWRSEASGRNYPVDWRLSSQQFDFDLVLRARRDDQELRLSTTYWEGALRAEGRLGSAPTAGLGYLEMTGRSGAEPGHRAGDGSAGD